MTTWSIRVRPIAFAAAAMRFASRSSLPGKPVSNSSDCPLGATKSVEAPPSTSIQEIRKRPPPVCAIDGQTRTSTPTSVAASARVMCVSPSIRLNRRVRKEPTATGEYLSVVPSATPYDGFSLGPREQAFGCPSSRERIGAKLEFDQFALGALSPFDVPDEVGPVVRVERATLPTSRRIVDAAVHPP